MDLNNILALVQNEEIFVQLDELDELGRNNLIQAQKTF